jgi:archaellum biogenesis protein FlaJ (TadC family)
VPVSKIARVVVSCALLTFVVLIPPLLSYFGKESTALLTLVCLLIALMALNVNIDQLEQIGLGPLSAKLRAKIAEATDLSERLKRAIELTLSVAVSAAMRSGRFADKDRAFQKKLIADVDEIA